MHLGDADPNEVGTDSPWYQGIMARHIRVATEVLVWPRMPYGTTIVLPEYYHYDATVTLL